MTAKVKVNLNSMSKPMVELSVTNFHFVKPGLIKHVLLVWMGLYLIFTMLVNFVYIKYHFSL